MIAAALFQGSGFAVLQVSILHIAKTNPYFPGITVIIYEVLFLLLHLLLNCCTIFHVKSPII